MVNKIRLLTLSIQILNWGNLISAIHYSTRNSAIADKPRDAFRG